MPSVSNPFPLFAALITRQRGFVGDIVRWKTFKIDSLGDKNGRTKREVRIEIFQFARWRIFLFQYFIFRQRFNLESKLISMMREFSLSLFFLFLFFLKKRKLTRALESYGTRWNFLTREIVKLMGKRDDY